MACNITDNVPTLARSENKRSKSGILRAFTGQTTNKQSEATKPPVLQATPNGYSASHHTAVKSSRRRSLTASALLRPSSTALTEANCNTDNAEAMKLGGTSGGKRGRSESPVKSKGIKTSRSISNLANLFSKTKNSKTLDPAAAPSENKENRSPERPANFAGNDSQWNGSAPSSYGSAEQEVKDTSLGKAYAGRVADTPLREQPKSRAQAKDGPDGLVRGRKPMQADKSVAAGQAPSATALHGQERIPSSTSARGFANGNANNIAKNHTTHTRQKEDEQDRKASSTSTSTKRSSRVMATVAMYNTKTREAEDRASLKGKDLDAAFEAVLMSRNVPESMRPNMRSLDDRIKVEFIKNDTMDFAKIGGGAAGSNNNESKRPALVQRQSSAKESSKADSLEQGRSGHNATNPDIDGGDEAESPTKRSRSRSRGFTLGKSDRSPSKRPRSLSRPRSLMSLKNLSSSSVNTVATLDGASESKDKAAAFTRPDDFIQYLRGEQNPEVVEVGKLHKLRLLVRNETISWVDTFILNGGMDEIVRLLKSIMQMEWREEHEDLLLHEVLLCMKGLCTTERALGALAQVQSTLFPELLKMLFDEERKGPSEYNTRGIIIGLLFSYLASAPPGEQESRARTLLLALSDTHVTTKEAPASFILDMHQRRPYQIWCKELSNVTKEVFWIFLHHGNVVPVINLSAPTTDSFRRCHFPRERAPVPAAPYVGGVEWDATMYLAAHLDLLNGLVASLPGRAERCVVREEVRASGIERLMGGTLRLCKDKFYGAVHDGLKTWVAAALEDAWPVEDVRLGPPREESRSPGKKSKAPQLELPKLDLDVGISGQGRKDEDWI